MDIVFEDDFILVVNKPAGQVVNRSETTKGPTLQDELFAYFKQMLPRGSDPNIGDRAGIVHRLDRETSGLLVVAKTKKSFCELQRQFKDREVKKEYVALAHGKVSQDEGVIDQSILRIGNFGKFSVIKKHGQEGKEAVTEFKVGGRYEIDDISRVISGDANMGQDFTKSRINYLKHHAREYTLLQLFPKTGRTHQIRVHLKSLNHPVVSDLIYAPHKLLQFDLSWCPRLFLHAVAIEFVHPKTKKRVNFNANLPQELRDAQQNLQEIKSI